MKATGTGEKDPKNTDKTLETNRCWPCQQEAAGSIGVPDEQHDCERGKPDPGLRPVYTQAEWDEREERIASEVADLGREREDWKSAAQIHLETIANRQAMVEELRAEIERLRAVAEAARPLCHLRDDAYRLPGVLSELFAAIDALDRKPSA